MSQIQSQNNEAKEVGLLNATDNVSMIREYLETGRPFAWPIGSIEESFAPNVEAPFLHEGRLDNVKSSTGYVDKKCMNPKFMAFEYSFAVKEFRTALKTQNTAQKEVKNMRDLHHPHIAGLLETFKHRGRLNILIFPAASCDLGDLMHSIPNDLIQLRSDQTSLSASGTNSTSASPRPETRKETPHFTLDGTKQDGVRNSIVLQQPPTAKIAALQGYFICLAQATQYLHKSGLRHKDIKPENALIDSRGYILLTDFGISKKFDENTSHETNSELVRTPRYQSPEKYEGRPRDDSDDVFMLGCVFLEMASLILGKDWNTFKRHFSQTVNLTATNDTICCNLGKLDSWIEIILKSEENAINATPNKHR